MPVPKGLLRRELPQHERTAIDRRRQERERMNAHFGGQPPQAAEVRPAGRGAATPRQAAAPGERQGSRQVGWKDTAAAKEGLAQSGGLHHLLRMPVAGDPPSSAAATQTDAAAREPERCRADRSHHHRHHPASCDTAPQASPPHRQPACPAEQRRALHHSLAATVASNLAALSATTGGTTAAAGGGRRARSTAFLGELQSNFTSTGSLGGHDNAGLQGRWVAPAFSGADTGCDGMGFAFPSVPSQVSHTESQGSGRTRIPSHSEGIVPAHLAVPHPGSYAPQAWGGGAPGDTTEGKPSTDSPSPSPGKARRAAEGGCAVEPEGMPAIPPPFEPFGEVHPGGGGGGVGGAAASGGVSRVAQLLDAQEASQELASTVVSLNQQLRALQEQAASERAEATKRDKEMSDLRNLNTRLEERNRALQDTVNRCNEEVAAALRRSGEEMAHQWQEHKELQIKLAEQASLLQETSGKLREVTAELRQKDNVLDGLRTKIREKDERLKGVISLAARQSSVASTAELPPPAVSPGKKPQQRRDAAQPEQQHQQQHHDYDRRQHQEQQQHHQHRGHHHHQQQQHDDDHDHRHQPRHQQQHPQHHGHHHHQQQQQQQQHDDDDDDDDQPRHQQQQHPQQQQEYHQHHVAQPVNRQSGPAHPPQPVPESPEPVPRWAPQSSVDVRCAPSPGVAEEGPRGGAPRHDGAALWEEMKAEALEARLQRLEQKLAPMPAEEACIEDLLPFDVPEPCDSVQLLPPPVSSVRPKVRRARVASPADAQPVLHASKANTAPVGQPASQPCCDAVEVPVQPASAGAQPLFPQAPAAPRASGYHTPDVCDMSAAQNTSASSLHSYGSLQYEPQPAAPIQEPDSSCASPDRKPSRIPKKTTPNRGMGTAWLVS